MGWGNLGIALGGSVGKLIGGYMDRQEARHSAKQNYTYNSWLQGQNENFQKYMAQNAHQMEVEDLKKAGLNPVLSANGSSAASIASSSAGGSAGGGANGGYFGGAADTALQAIGINSAKDLNQSQEELNSATAIKTMNEAGVIKPKAEAEVRKLISDTTVNSAKIMNMEKERELIDTAKKLNSAKTAHEKEQARRIRGGKATEYTGTKVLGKLID